MHQRVKWEIAEQQIFHFMALSLGDERIHLKISPLAKQCFLSLKKRGNYREFKNASVNRIG
ncbi:hypothetical protein D3C78_85180 [compost metagenome]